MFIDEKANLRKTHRKENFRFPPNNKFSQLDCYFTTSIYLFCLSSFILIFKDSSINCRGKKPQKIDPICTLIKRHRIDLKWKSDFDNP